MIIIIKTQKKHFLTTPLFVEINKLNSFL